MRGLWMAGLAGVLLVVGTVLAVPASRHTLLPGPAAPARVVTLEIGGMSCAACVAKIEAQLATVPGVTRAEVSLADQRAVVSCRAGVADTALTAAVRRAGPDYLGLIVAR